MSELIQFLKIVMITLLLTQHGFAIAKPMNCEDSPKDSINTETVQLNSTQDHQTNTMLKHDHKSDSHSKKHNHSEEECEKCKAGDCLCCEGGVCASFHLTACLTGEDGQNNENIDLVIISHIISAPQVGVHLLPYRPPIVS